METKPKKVLIANFKGGVGKTLIADELLYKLEKDKIPFSFINKDPQGSAAHEPVDNPEAVVEIVDTQGHLSDDYGEMFAEADFIICPTVMSPSDQKPFETMITLLTPWQDKKPILYVFNCWARFTYSKEFIEYFNIAYPHIKTTILSRTTGFRDAGKFGLSLEEYQPTNPAVKQIDHIYSSMKYELNLKDWRLA